LSRWSLTKNAKKKQTSIGATLLALFIIGVIYYLRHRSGTPVVPSGGLLPKMLVKPSPWRELSKTGPPEGDGGDPELNRLKNREDEGNYLPVAFEAIGSLLGPQAVERRNRAKWAIQRRARSRVTKHPVAVEGYLAQVKEEGQNRATVTGTDHEFTTFISGWLRPLVKIARTPL